MSGKAPTAGPAYRKSSIRAGSAAVAVPLRVSGRGQRRRLGYDGVPHPRRIDVREQPSRMRHARRRFPAGTVVALEPGPALAGIARIWTSIPRPSDYPRAGTELDDVHEHGRELSSLPESSVQPCRVAPVFFCQASNLLGSTVFTDTCQDRPDTSVSSWSLTVAPPPTRTEAHVGPCRSEGSMPEPSPRGDQVFFLSYLNSGAFLIVSLSASTIAFSDPPVRWRTIDDGSTST